ncbi:MAG TPA: DUF1294 domain-containing protein [Sphingopyxis sp.]|nr:DUF1294 domain-containing protein [Sphingopyxis sp.]
MSNNIILIWIGAFSAAAFFAMWLDKQRALADKSRLSERGLLRIMALGGALGGLAASRIFRHKSRKQPFLGTMWFLAILQIGALIWWFFIADPLPDPTHSATLAGALLTA